MSQDLLRIFGVAIVGTILVMPSSDYLDALSNTTNQLIAGIIVVVSIFFIDPVFGALLGLAILIWFFKMNYRTVFIKSLTKKQNEKETMKYGTPKNLVDAQTNVVDEKMMSTEMIGFDTVYGEQVIGAQGLDKNMPGYDTTEVVSLAPI